MEAKSKESKNRMPSIVEAGALAAATTVKPHGRTSNNGITPIASFLKEDFNGEKPYCSLHVPEITPRVNTNIQHKLIIPSVLIPSVLIPILAFIWFNSYEMDENLSKNETVTKKAKTVVVAPNVKKDDNEVETSENQNLSKNSKTVASEVKTDDELFRQDMARLRKNKPSMLKVLKDHNKAMKILEDKGGHNHQELKERIAKLYDGMRTEHLLPNPLMKELELRSDWDVKVKQDVDDFFYLLDTFSRIMKLRLPDSTKQYLFYYSLQCIEPVWNKTVPANLEGELKKYAKKNHQDISNFENDEYLERHSLSRPRKIFVSKLLE